MSIPVALERLREEAGRFERSPYLLTVADEGRPHAVATAVLWREGVWVARVGKRSAANLVARPEVSLLWPPSQPDGYSLIVDGRASLEGEGEAARAVITPSRGVLHRPATEPPPEGSACSADCVPLLR